MQLSWKKIFSNTFLLLIARVISKIATVVVMVYAARALGTNLFGVFSAVIALTQFAGLISDFGLVMPTIRNISRQTDNHFKVVADTFSARLFWSIIALVTLTMGGLIMEFSFVIVLLLAVSSIFEYSALALVRSFEGKQQIQTVTFYTLVERFYFSIIVVLALWKFKSLEAVAVAYVFSSLSMFIFACYLFSKGIGKLKLELNILKFKSITKLGFPFFVTAIFSTLYYRADILLLSWFRTDSEVGIYNAALRLIDAQMFIPMSMMTTIYPLLSKTYISKELEFFKIFKSSLIIFICIGFGLTIILFFIADPLISILYPPEYEKGSSILKVLSLMLIFYFSNFLLSQSLIAVGKEMMFTLIMILSAVIYILIGLLFIPTYGYLGAAWIRVAVEFFMSTAFTFFIIKNSRDKLNINNINSFNNKPII